ncbi:hypothetical protein P12x_002540 [Tundrisphaera lichenicola]|uniref:hypothetical protein n=1 Tax=Tundrisphaera lichenicola TaxID=2029860 RepID=UPI003EBB7D1E
MNEKMGHAWRWKFWLGLTALAVALPILIFEFSESAIVILFLIAWLALPQWALSEWYRSLEKSSHNVWLTFSRAEILLTRAAWYFAFLVFYLFVSLSVVKAFVAVDRTAWIWIFDGGGLSKMKALVRNDPSIRLDSLQINNNERRVICTDPAILRHFEEALRSSDPTKGRGGIRYEVELRFKGGGNFGVTTYWEADDFSISMPDEDPFGEKWPTRRVEFKSPMPPPVKAMIDFLDSPTKEVRGTVLVIEPGGIHQESL